MYGELGDQSNSSLHPLYIYSLFAAIYIYIYSIRTRSSSPATPFPYPIPEGIQKHSWLRLLLLPPQKRGIDNRVIRSLSSRGQSFNRPALCRPRIASVHNRPTDLWPSLIVSSRLSLSARPCAKLKTESKNIPPLRRHDARSLAPTSPPFN